MPDETTLNDSVIEELNDLLKLDHDAIGGYTLAIENLVDESYKQSLRSYRGDHERHVRELSELITSRGGLPVHSPHLLSGPFKLGMQQVGALGGDEGILLAFKTNERQVRDRYRQAANRAGHDPVVALVLSRGAADEERHYRWVQQLLNDLGLSPESRAGRAEQIVESGQARMADAAEALESGVSRVASRTRARVSRTLRNQPIRVVLTAVGFGVAAFTYLRRRSGTSTRD